MVDITCKKCQKKFASEKNLKRHQNNCNFGSKTNKKLRFKCDDCGSYFTRKDSLTRHKNSRCKKIKQSINMKGNNNKLTNANLNVKLNGSKVKNINNINNSPNSNNVYNIMLFSFGTDGIAGIDMKTFKKIVGSKENIIESIISNVNFDPTKPQHHNIYYGDTKSSYGEVYENKTWVRKKIDEILDTLIEAKITDLSDILNDYSDFLNKKTRNKIKQTIENMDYTKPNARKKLKTYLKPILYNHKDMIIKTRKLTKKQEEDFFRKEQLEAELEAEKEEEEMKKKLMINKKAIIKNNFN